MTTKIKLDDGREAKFCPICGKQGNDGNPKAFWGGYLSEVLVDLGNGCYLTISLGENWKQELLGSNTKILERQAFLHR